MFAPKPKREELQFKLEDVLERETITAGGFYKDPVCCSMKDGEACTYLADIPKTDAQLALMCWRREGASEEIYLFDWTRGPIHQLEEDAKKIMVRNLPTVQKERPIPREKVDLTVNSFISMYKEIQEKSMSVRKNIKP